MDKDRYRNIKLKWASQVAPVIKNPAASAGDVRGAGSIPGWGRSGEGYGNPPVCLPGESHGQMESGRLQSMGSQKVGHALVTEYAHMHTCIITTQAILKMIGTPEFPHVPPLSQHLPPPQREP